MKQILKLTVFLGALCLLSFPVCFSAQTQAPSGYGLIKLNVGYRAGPKIESLKRKRFFLIKGTRAQNQSLIERIRQTSVPTRDCYYRNHGASDRLIAWLKKLGCDSVYCHGIDSEFLTGGTAVDEFQTAYAKAFEELKNENTARRWLANYLPPEIRSGLYDEKQKAIESLLALAQPQSKPVISVMTDRTGIAYFANIAPGSYTITNLIASEGGAFSYVWICDQEVTAGTKTLNLSRDLPACEVISRPVPACEK